jgi:hypothetical protein
MDNGTEMPEEQYWILKPLYAKQVMLMERFLIVE